METMELDVLAVGAHPDDAEIGCGGFLIKMKKLGYRTGVIHLTLGEMGSRGDAKIRAAEIDRAAEVMGLDHVEVLGLKDCQVTDDHESRLKMAEALRRVKPKMILGPYWQGTPGRGLGHSDHLACGNLVLHGANFAHLAKLPISGEPHAAQKVLHYFLPMDVMPTFVVDVTEHIEGWMDAVKAHHSQFFNPKTEKYDAIHFIEGMASHYGRMIRVKYGAGFRSNGPLTVEDPFVFIK